MRLVPEIQITNLLALTSELFGMSKIINLPEKAEYNFQDTLNVLLRAATSNTNSIESASNDFRIKTPNKNVPSADSIHDLKGTYQDAAIDFHDIPYYGDKNTPGIRGIKPKNGTSWGYSFCSLDIIGDVKLTLDVIDINGLAKNYSILMESMMQRLKAMEINLRTLFMDREFFNNPTISTLQRLNKNYVIAAKSNKKINAILLELYQKNSRRVSKTLEHRDRISS